MKKGTKSFGGFIVVTLSAILIIAAIVAAAFYNEVVIPEPETQAFAAGDEYVHGSDIGRRPSGTAGTDYYNVSTYSDFRTRVNNNQNINLTSNITFENGSLRSTASYTGTIYGNGHTITFDFSQFPSSNGNAQNALYAGLLVGQLNGNIYDLKIVLTGGVIFKSGYHDENIVAGFGMVGYIKPNSTINNVNITVNSGAGIIAYTTDNSNQIALGLVAGYAENCTINNITINNNGTIAAGYFGNSNGSGTFSDLSVMDSQGSFDSHTQPRSASHIVGGYYSGTVSLNNIIIKGSGTVFGREATNLGCTWSSKSIVTGTNFLNHFTGTFNGPGHESAGFTKWNLNSSTNIDTYFEYYDGDSATVSAKGTYNATISEKLSFRTTGVYANMQILFDPSTSNYNNSLVVLYTNQTTPGGVIRLWSLGSNDNGRTFSGTEENGTVIFADLPVQSIWNNNDWGTGTYSRGDGYFEATLSYTDLAQEDDLTEYEHGYVSADTPTSGTPINSGTEFENIFASNEAYGDPTKNYYLADDIIITGFTGYGSDNGFSGTLDGKGHTIYIHAARTGLDAENIGGLMGKINGGTVKNLRVALVNDLNISTSASKKTNTALGIGMITGWLTGNGLIENCNVVIKEGVTVYGAADNQDCTVAGVAGVMTGRGRVFNTTVQLDGTLKVKRSYPFIAGFVGLSEKPNFESDSVNTIPFEFKNIVFKGIGSFAGIAENTGGENVNLAAVTITPNVTQNVGQWIDMDGVIYDFSEDYWNEAASSNDIPSGYGLISQNFASDNPGGLKPTTINGTKYIDYKNLYRATEYAPVKTPAAGDSGNTAYNIPIDNTIEVTVSSAAGGTISNISVTPYFRPGSDGNITLVASGTGVSGFNGVLKEKGATIGEGKDSIPAAAKDGDNLVLEMPKADVVSGSDTSVGLEEAKTVTLTTDINKSFTYSGSSQARDVYLKYGESSISDYTVTYAAESGSELSNGSPVNAGSYYISVVALTENAGDYYFFDAASNTLSKSYTYASADENINKFVIKPAEVELAFGSDSMTVTYDAKAVENPEVSVSDGTFGLDDLGELTYVWMNADGTTLPANPTNAGSYQVMISAVANPNFTVGGDAASGNDFTIKAKEVTLSVKEGGTSFVFAQDTGALTDENYENIGSYSFSVDGFVEEDDGNSGYTVSITTTEGDPDPSFITENTTDGTTGTSYLSAGVYTATVVLSSRNYTFGEGKKIFTVTVNENSSANKWLTEYARGDWTYYSNPTAETTPVARFGSPAITYSNGNEGFSNTTAQGTYKVNVSVAETDNYGALTEEYSFTVSALDVTVALSAADTVYDGQPYEASNISITLTATVNGEETTYTSANNSSDVSTLLGSYGWKHSAEGVTETTGLPTDAGTYTLYIYNFSNNNVKVTETSNCTCTATIEQAKVTFSATIAGDAKLVYGTVPTDFKSLVKVTASGGINLSANNWSYTVTPYVENGKYEAKTPAGTTVTLTVQVSVTDPNHTAVQPAETLTLVIQKADIGEISVTNFGSVRIELDDGSIKQYPGFVYDQAEELVFSGIPADLTVKPVYTYAKQDGKQIENFDILTADSGIYTVTVSITGDTNYNDKTKAIEFAIAKADQSVTVKIDGWTYKETENAPVIEGIKEGVTPTVSYSGKTNADTNNSYGPTDVVPTEAGTYTVTVSWDETTNYTAGSVKSAEFTIAKATGFANISVNGTPYTKTVTAYYTGSAQPFKVTVEGHGGEIYIDGNHSSTMNFSLTDAGTTTVKVTVAQTANYTESTATTVEIEILPAVIQSVTLKTTKFAFGTLNTENANDAATYGTADVAFVEYKGSVSPEFTYSLSYSKTENGNDEKAYIVVGEEYILTLALTGETAANFVFDGNTSTTAVTVQVTKGKNTWTSQDEIDDYPFGFAGKPVTGTAKFGTAAVTYYRGDVTEQADKGSPITSFSFAAQGVSAGTYTAVVTVPGNVNYDDAIPYEYTFVVTKHRLSIEDLEISRNDKVSGSAATGFTYTYAANMVLSATVSVGSAEGYAGNYSDLLGDLNTRTYLFEYSADAAEPKVWKDGLPKDAGKYTVRFKGMELEEGKDINNFVFVYEGDATELTTKLTINKATVSASAELKGDIVYGMTVDEIKELVSVSEGVSMKDVAVTYVNESNESVVYSETTPSGTELTITVTVEAEDDKNYTVDSDTVELKKTVQKAKLTVRAVDGSEHSATFVPDVFNAFEQVEAKWGENLVEASEYLLIELTGYSGEVAGDPKTNFGNGEIGVYTFTVKLTDDDAKNFLMVDADGAEYEGELTFTYALATEKVTLTVKLIGWTYGDTPNNPTFTVTDADGNSIGMQTIGQYISVKYEGINGTEYDLATAPTEAGDYKITAAIIRHPDYVAEEEATKEFTIGKRPIALALSSDSASAYYDRRVAITDFTSKFGEYFSVAEGYSYAGHALKDVFTLTASSDSGDVTEIKNAGIYKITAVLVNDNYTWAEGASSPVFAYTIEKAIVSIQMAYKEANIYDGAPVDVPVLSLLRLVNGEEYGTKDQFTDVEALIKDDEELMAILRAITIKYNGDEPPTNAGKYTFIAYYPGNDNYAAADYQGYFIIDKAYIGEFSIKVPSHSYTGEILAGQIPVLTGGNSELSGEGLSETVSYFVWNGKEYESVETATNVGQYKIVRTSPESNNYHDATAECEFTISPATVTINDYTASYDFGFIAAELKDEYPYVIALTASVSADFADEITYSTELIGDHGSEQGYLNVGSYTLKIVLTNGNYAFTEGAGEIAIEIVPSENKFVSVTKRDRWIYGNKPADINVSVAYGSANIVTYDSEGNVVELSAATYAGSYYDVVTVPASEFGNYAAIEYAGDTSFVIGKATFKWSWEFLPDNIVYGDSLDGAFVINEPEVTGGIESDFVYFVYNTNAVYSVGGEVYSYDPQTDAGTVVTISAQCVWSDETPEGIKTSYVIDPDEFGAIAFNMEVQKKPIAVTAVSLSDIYGSAFDPTGDANEYFGGSFLYNGAPITNLTAQNSVVVIEISGSGLADDRLNAGNYTVTVSVGGNHYIESAEDGTLENGCVSVGYTVMPKTLNISDGKKSLSYEFGMLSPEDLNASDAILNFIGGANGLFDGLAFGDSLTAGDFTLSAAQDYSAFVSEGYMIVSAEPYIVNVALSATSGNYIAPETGLDDIGIYVVKAANRIYGYSVPGWTYLDVLSEYIPSALPSARFGVVEYGFFAPDGSEMTMDKFNSETPAGTYSFRFSVQGTDNYDSAVLTGEFVVDKLIVVAELTATDVTYDGAVYDGISHTLSPDVSDYIGTVGYEYSENGSAFRKGLPTDAGNYSVRIGEYSDSENIELRAETVDFQINPAPMHFTVTGVDGASVEYGTAVADIDVNALIVSVIPDSYVGGFEFTVSLITANGTAYRPGLYAGTTLYATVDITLDSNNYYPVVDTAIEMLPKVTVAKVSHDMAFEVNDEIITDGSSATVIEGSANTVIDAISYYMSINDIQYYEYHITVDGEEYSRDFVWAPGSHTVEVRLSGNHEGSTQFTVVIEENPDAVDRAPFTPKTVVGEVLESINFTWASAVSIAFGVAVAVLIILFFGLRRAKRK